MVGTRAKAQAPTTSILVSSTATFRPISLCDNRLFGLFTRSRSTLSYHTASNSLSVCSDHFAQSAESDGWRPRMPETDSLEKAVGYVGLEDLGAGLRLPTLHTTWEQGVMKHDLVKIPVEPSSGNRLGICELGNARSFARVINSLVVVRR